MQVFRQTPSGMLYVDLFADGQSVRERLVNVGLAQVSKVEPTSPAPPPHVPLPLHKPVVVELTAAQTPWDFHVQQVRGL